MIAIFIFVVIGCVIYDILHDKYEHYRETHNK